jgi:ABC-type maltose transport system permease subunit
MAVATMGLVPIIAVFLAAQKYFISGFVTSGLKS